jgi:hypothetical protein
VSSAHPSGLGPKARIDARHRTVYAARLAYSHRGAIHYTQGSRRWDGIAKGLHAYRGRYPNYADCSAFATWCLWNGMHLEHGVRDVVNGLGWRAGYTGTMLNHGHAVSRSSLLAGDLVIYGHGFPGHHVAIYVGGGKVISHGSEAGPLLLPVGYRGDVMACRRYI